MGSGCPISQAKGLCRNGPTSGIPLESRQVLKRKPVGVARSDEKPSYVCRPWELNPWPPGSELHYGLRSTTHHARQASQSCIIQCMQNGGTFHTIIVPYIPQHCIMCGTLSLPRLFPAYNLLIISLQIITFKYIDDKDIFQKVCCGILHSLATSIWLYMQEDSERLNTLYNRSLDHSLVFSFSLFIFWFCFLTWCTVWLRSWASMYYGHCCPFLCC